jgi:beta-N-acetylhexosaminidase
VLAVIAGTDLLCLGRDIDQLTFLAVRAALVEAVKAGRLPGERLEEAAARVAELRSWTAEVVRDTGPAPGRPANAGVGRPDLSSGDRGAVGLAAARRAVQVVGNPPPLRRPLVVQLVPPSNIAVGSVPWGLGPWLPAESIRQVSTATPPSDFGSVAARLLAEATGRSLVIIVRDAHRFPADTALVTELLAGRPDAIVVEMGLPVWRPPAATYVASYGAGHSNALAVAEILGLADSGTDSAA